MTDELLKGMCAQAANMARPAKKPSAGQLRILRRMANHGATLRLELWYANLLYADGDKWMTVRRVSFDAIRNAGWIEPLPYGADRWRVSDAGRKAAE